MITNLPAVKFFNKAKIKSGKRRSKDLGLLIVVGGPGGSGASTVAKMLARHFGLTYLYGGAIMRRIAKKKGFDSIEAFLNSDLMREHSNKIDIEVDEGLLKASFRRNVLIDSKDFAALSTYRNIPTSIKIWLTADIDVRVHRMLWSTKKLAKTKTLSKRTRIYKDASLRLMQRYSNDKNRYKKLYNIDYDHQENYNDIVLDTTHLNAGETFNLILDLMKNGRK